MRGRLSPAVRYKDGHQLSAEKKTCVPLDKSEGTVKAIVVLGSAGAPLRLPERLRTKTLEISR